MKILKDEKPDFIACVFDTSAPTFRHKLYPEYKATREKMPEDLVEQLPMIREVVKAFSVVQLEREGYEADDVMGTLARQAEEAGLHTFLVTGDKDFMQLVSDNVQIISLGRSSEIEIIDARGVKDKMGVRPDQIIDLLGLMGDSSDNVPGIPGVGPKTALSLLQQFERLDNVLQASDQIERKSLREKVELNKELARLSKELVTIETHVPLSSTLEDLRKRPIDRETVVELFQQLEFTRSLTELSQFEQGSVPAYKREYTIIDTEAGLDSLIAALENSGLFALDLETTALDPITAEIVGLSFSWKPHQAVYVPVMVPPEVLEGELHRDGPENARALILEKLRPVLEDSVIRKCGQNIKYDMLVLNQSGIDLQGVEFDSMIAAYLANPSARQFGIDTLALEYLHIQKIPTTALIGKGSKQITMAEVPLDKVSEYACEDADVALQLRNTLEPRLKDDHLLDLLAEVEIPLIRVLMEMECAGVALDTVFLSNMSVEMDVRLQTIQSDIYEMAGEEFNINSTQQLGAILFEKLKIHEVFKYKPRRTKTGYSTDVQALESLSAHPLPKTLLDYRQLKKLKSTYIDALPKLINPRTGRLHTSFNQTVTTTGRLSTSDPNLQNIPIRTDLGREIRKAFIPQNPEWLIMSADYSQIELKIMAHLSADKTLIESFREGEDVHRRTAAEIFNLDPESVTDEYRRRAKTINFGIMYGMGPYGLARRLSIPHSEAEQFITAYFERYPGVNQYMTSIIADAYEKGYVTTLLNRRRYLPELKSSNRNIREFGERTAINTPIQGTAADLIKVAMIRIGSNMRNAGYKSKMILQVHDELIFEVSREEQEDLKTMVRHEMENAIKLTVLPSVEIGVGKNWFEAH